ncbi:hypothetical protein MPSEU_000292700 [Mayamaea pseudoterrestris]|nr:hypothetical protein MPSEU_000292700 [Mayamaea pseudoterrestris]
MQRSIGVKGCAALLPRFGGIERRSQLAPSLHSFRFEHKQFHASFSRYYSNASTEQAQVRHEALKSTLGKKTEPAIFSNAASATASPSAAAATTTKALLHQQRVKHGAMQSALAFILVLVSAQSLKNAQEKRKMERTLQATRMELDEHQEVLRHLTRDDHAMRHLAMNMLQTVREHDNETERLSKSRSSAWNWLPTIMRPRSSAMQIADDEYDDVHDEIVNTDDDFTDASSSSDNSTLIHKLTRIMQDDFLRRTGKAGLSQEQLDQLQLQELLQKQGLDSQAKEQQSTREQQQQQTISDEQEDEAESSAMIAQLLQEEIGHKFCLRFSINCESLPAPMATTAKTSPRVSMKWTRLTPSVDPQTGDKPLARSSHGVSLLQNPRRLFVYGGEHEARTPIAPDQAAWEVDLQDETSLQWRKIDCSHGPPPRIAHAQAVHAATNKVYIFGGRAGILMGEQALNDLWCYDGNDGAWTQVIAKESSQSTPCARSFHRMVCIDDALFVFGGCGQAGRLNDLHKFDLLTLTWECLPESSLKGRGGPNLVPLSGGRKLGVIAGFAGEETNDGQVYDIENRSWTSKDGLMATELKDMRPRSVCVSGSFPSASVSIIFGGEVNPSDRGHEGAGGFANDVCIMDETTGAFIESVVKENDSEDWPDERGWSDAATIDHGDGTGDFYIFAGLAGDDKNPQRLDDLWKLEIRNEATSEA